ncbi:hypothetical protein CspHIS471_0405840 [Cutaneotrichosporon sp. HIS471]|nr:hypothetical protein CspHIS471_0405840 [Cutaneotrichosporon sp. HIS471]
MMASPRRKTGSWGTPYSYIQEAPRFTEQPLYVFKTLVDSARAAESEATRPKDAPQYISSKPLVALGAPFTVVDFSKRFPS